MSKWVYSFGGRETEGNATMRNLLGGKGANLAEMAALDLPVPAGFTITTEVCTYFYDTQKSYPADLEKQVEKALQRIESAVQAKFGDNEFPLLVSVRSGARVSMPGMMDTVLNLGLNDKTVRALAKNSGNERFAYDSYRRFIQMYSNVVLGLDHHDLEDIIDSHKRREGVTEDTDMDAAAWKRVVTEFKALVKKHTGEDFPESPKEQLWGAIGAVFKSWDTQRAKVYRQLHNIPEKWGTAVNIQAMVFGNMGSDCATGVAFTRDPSTGENIFYGEYLVNAQGEDVVAGIRTPQSLTIQSKEKEGSHLPAMEEVMPVVFKQLKDVRTKLETHYKDMQDIEFTVQDNKLYMLQTRNGKRTGAAALKIAVDMVNEGLISKEEAVLRVDPESLNQLLHPSLDPKAAQDVIAKGLPASPGSASGRIVFTADEAERLAGEYSVILVRQETSPEDIHGMHAADGILTSRGGMTSHAAVVARGMGRPCVAGAGTVIIDAKAQTLKVGNLTLHEGDMLTIDGSTGNVINGQVPTIAAALSADFGTLMGWSDSFRTMGVRTNADTAEDCKTALNFGAEGVGLCRTEHMFFDGDRIQRVREMIFADDSKKRKKALDYIRPMQRDDFFQIFKAMEGLPVTIRLLDPPLHEFLPHDEDQMVEFAATAEIALETVKTRLAQLHESNPMLGHRGCRLGITYPEIYDMQVEAILEAALDIKSKGKAVLPEIMVPLVSTRAELSMLKKRIEAVAKKVFDERKDKVEYMIGTMIELPRAALTAEKIAEDAEFFSFGTNDLTQTTLGISRDDAGSFLPLYTAHGIYERDPFASIDIEGVGQLIEIACEKGRSVRADIKLGICGEHGGDPDSIAFCAEQGLSYVSCSPFRVPIARLAAAQAAIRLSKKAQTKKKAA
jgi:pyruvate,orthophosphate dikinase